MNKIASIAAAIAAFSTSAVFAASPADASCANCAKPVPVYVVSPTELPTEAQNQTVHLAMTIDAQGVPHDIRPESFVDQRIARRLQVAVSQWRFRPEYVNGQAVSARVVLPVTLAGESDASTHDGLTQASTIHAN